MASPGHGVLTCIRGGGDAVPVRDAGESANLLLFGLTALTKVAERVVSAGTGAQLRILLAQPWAPALLIALLCAALAGVVALASRVTARTLARFTPESRGG